MKRFGLLCLTLALALGVPLATVGTSNAAPGAVPKHGRDALPAAAAACWPEGTRLKKTTEGRVYLIGPGNALYWIHDPDSYNALWGNWDGILTVPDADFDACYHNGSRWLWYASLIKAPCCAAVYIYDYSYKALRHIVDWNTFTNKYHFDPSKITTGIVVNVDHDHPWT